MNDGLTAKQRWHQKNKERLNEKSRLYREANKEKILERERNYYKNNKVNLAKADKIYYENNKAKIAEYNKIYRKNNKEGLHVSDKKRYQLNPLFKLKKNIRTIIGKGFRVNGYTKSSKTQNILGCSFDEFKEHIQSKFEPWMNWDNKGLYNGEKDYGWDIDHIIPLSSAETVEDVIRLNHYTNLQPLCSYINRDIKKHHY